MGRRGRFSQAPDLAWLPTTELRLFEMNDEVASQALINCDDGTHVRARPQAYGKAQGCIEKGMRLFGACNVSVADRRF
jgi:hypothetical protein